jgi:hypothetical protein
MMTLLNLIVLILIAGILLWGVNVYIPMASAIKSLLNLLVLVVLVIYILQFFDIIRMILPYPNIFK